MRRWCPAARAQGVAQARDKHYHKPPGYLVIEPEDTSLRTINLQQTNTSGYKFQGTVKQLVEAKKYVEKLRTGTPIWSIYDDTSAVAQKPGATQQR